MSANCGVEDRQTEVPSNPQTVQRAARIRGTQSFLSTLADCWRKPSLLGLELLWRWGFGIPALALLGWQVDRILSSVSLAGTGVDKFSLIDTYTAAQIVSAVSDRLQAPALYVARWLFPLLATGWALASGWGRTLVLRRYSASLRPAPWLMVGLQLVRIIVLGASFAVWLVCLHWAAWVSLSGPQPSLVIYFILTIACSFAVFVSWAVIGWIFSVAPLLAVLERTGLVTSLWNAARLGRGSLHGLRSKLVEINLVLGIVKLALMVLAMVFCATPVPFKAEINGSSLLAWWMLVTVVYFAFSDFFQVARVIGFIELWRTANPDPEIRADSTTVAT